MLRGSFNLSDMSFFLQPAKVNVAAAATIISIGRILEEYLIL
ncbi:hypothetical protein M094_3832 [Bacteroides uniformis str. 3978 T3 ii]|uniref:Uncharacterized protein n=1 Tax=Bacteroides uniformis str. 3978 T3 ii TaxID=1339349 RepID=A0A078S5N4_BACUN|nr:hypothetical protein M094_3832 [Bacteroides uniformis str. 3978 T3 ii]